MAKTFKVTAVIDASIVLSAAGVESYIKAIRETSKAQPEDKFLQHLNAVLDYGDGDAALAQLFKQGIRDAVKDLADQLNEELVQDASRFKCAPATVTIEHVLPNAK